MQRPWPDDLDELDRGIIKMLGDDATLSNTALATSLGVAKTTIGTRIKRLADRGIMQVIAETDVFAAGYQVFASAAIQVRGRSARSVAHDLSKLPEVTIATSMIGGTALYVEFVARDLEGMAHFLEERIAVVDGVSAVQCSILLRTLKLRTNYKDFSHSRPSAGGLEQRFRSLESTALSERLDKLDLRIMAHLQEDGRRSLREIARQEEVSEGTVRARVKRLDDEKLLRRVAAVDPQALGVNSHAFFGLEVDPQRISTVADTLLGIPEVVYLGIIVGQFNIWGALQSTDRRALSGVINEQIAQIDGVRSIDVSEVVEVFQQDLCWTVFVD